MFNSRLHIPPVQQKLKKKRRSTDELEESGQHNQLNNEQNDVLKLQSTIGNRAVISRLSQETVQRTLPDGQQLIKQAGVPKKKSTRYKAIIEGLDKYRTFITTAKVDHNPRVAAALFERALSILNEINDDVTYFRETHDRGTLGKTKQKRGVIFGLLEQVQCERASMIKTQSRLSGGIPFIEERPTIEQALQGAGTSSSMYLYDSSKVESKKGGSSEVTKYEQQETEGYFKKNKSEFKYGSPEEAEQGMTEMMKEKSKLSDRRRQIGDEIRELQKDTSTDHTQEIEALTKEMEENAERDAQMFEQYNADTNEMNIGVEMVGINPKDTRMAARDVAMSRIGKLLGTDIIATAQFAIAEDPKIPENIPGSFMEKAEGRQLNKIENDGTLNKEDGELMRQLSNLQLIDILCFQVDRNMGNVFVVTNSRGEVTSLKGIDNDFSLGINTKFENRVQELPGVSKYVDIELAQRIIDLEPKVLADLVADLLTEPEIDALLFRLDKLKQILSRAKDKKQLLSRKQWTRAIAQKLIKEDRSYYAKLMGGTKWK